MKRSMRHVRSTSAPDKTLSQRRAQRRSWLSGKTDEEQLAAYRKDYHDCGHAWSEQNAYRNYTTERFAFAKFARLERLLCDAGGEW